MKYLILLISMIVAAMIGYSIEPSLRQVLTGKSKDWSKTPEKPIEVIVEEAPAIELALLWPADKLPEKVILKADGEIANETGEIKATVSAGNLIDLVKLDGTNAIISSGPGGFQGSVPIEQTDLIERLIELKKTIPAAELVPVTETVPAMETVPTTETAPVTETVPATDAVPTAEPVPSDTDIAKVDPFSQPAAETPDPATETVVVENPAGVAVVEPTPTPPAPPVGPAGSSNVVSVMQASIRAAEIKEFTFDQVLDWKAADAPEVVEGESYQVGMISYQAETVFGKKTIEAKALIKDGKVVRWLWPKSGMQIQ